jgi:tetratricopeptide (TPR) repeat protein
VGCRLPLPCEDIGERNCLDEDREVTPVSSFFLHLLRGSSSCPLPGAWSIVGAIVSADWCVVRWRNRFGVSASLSFLFVCAFGAQQSAAQRPPTPQPPPTRESVSGLGRTEHNLTTLAVSVREPSGMPLELAALVRLSSFGSGYNMIQGAQDNGTAYFQNVPAGDYQVEVSAPGYKTADDRITVYAAGGTQPVYVYVQPESQSNSIAPNGMVMTPKLQAEVDKGLSAMQKKQYESALEHFSRAAKMAPANPDILDLRGTAEYALKNPEGARADYEKALTIAPTHQHALLALGELRLESGDNAGAIKTLEKAFALNGADWRTHFLLGNAYFRLNDLTKAKAHAERSVELAKSKAAPARLLLGQILAAQGQEQEARQTIPLVAETPRDSSAPPGGHKQLAWFRTGGAPRSASLEPKQAPLEKTEADAPTMIAAASEPPALLDRTWAPPDTDSMSYAFAPDVSCRLPTVLSGAQNRMMQQLKNFERFTATEHIEHEEINSHGVPQDAKFKDFSYLVFVKRPPSHLVYLDETRDGSDSVANFPTSLATTGLVGLGVAVLTPVYSTDFDFTCEGLSSWRQQAAWQIRFEQKKDVRPRVRTWRKSGILYSIPLKGRLWIAANSYDLLHLESDLRDSIPKLDLTKDHLIIDYGPVPFEHGHQKLWLPWKAEMFMELHGHRYHHRHTLTNYLLFSVESEDHIGSPVASWSEPNLGH